jgi:putative tryptophan/tyrosine transport system substrate-binding protein
MKRRALVEFTVAAFTAPSLALAQQSSRAYRIAVLDDADETARKADWVEFRSRLRELGIVEGKNATFESRYASGEHERLPGLARELMASKPDIVVTTGTPAARAAIRAAASTPVVFIGAADPVGSGLVASLSRPGGSVTGLSVWSIETTQKSLELLHEISPPSQRIAFLTDPSNEITASIFSRLVENAQRLKVTVQMMDGIGRAALERSFELIRSEHFQALLVGTTGTLLDHRDEIVRFAARERLPAVYGRLEFVRAGGLLSYGVDRASGVRRAAEYVQRILQGESPANMPVEQISTTRVAINLKTARTLGIKVPDSIRLRADETIE